MKKCAFCAKEITYHEYYCSDDCQIDANNYYDKKEKYQKVFSVINGIFVLGIGIFIFLYSLIPAAGVIGAASCMIILGVTYLLLPFPVDTMIERFKLKKAIFLTRVVAMIVLFLGILALVLFLTGVL